MAVPSTIPAGQTLSFSEAPSGYPVADYSLAFVLNLNGQLLVSIAATVVGAAFAITATAATTAAWAPGRYNFAEYLTKTSDSSVTVPVTGQLSILPNFAANAALTPAQVQLAAIQAAISTLIANPFSSTTFNGQSQSQKDLKSMFDMRDRLQAQVDAELIALGLSTKGGARTIVTRFCG